MRRKGRAKTDFGQEIALIGNRQQWSAWALLVCVLLALPFILTWTNNKNWLTFLNFTLITVIAVLGLNVISGMSGQISLGHSAFVMLGGYILAIFTVQAHWPFWAALAMGIAITGIIGMGVATPALRLKGFYVAVVTMAFFFIAQFIIKNLDIAGGIHGLIGVPSPSIAGLKIDTDIRWYYLLFIVTLLCIIASANLSRSRFGRAFLAVRDNDITAASLGINVPLIKLYAFLIGSLFAGLAGGLWTSYLSLVRLDQYSIWDSIWYIGMIIIGGTGSTAGTAMGVIFLRLVSQLLHVIGHSELIHLTTNMTVSITYGVYGLVIIIFVSFRPHGLISIWRKLKAHYKQWPFGV